MEWRPYGACCYRGALQTDSAFCPECGRTLLRCMAFSECFSLIAPTQPCPVCIAPELAIDKGAITQSKIGERLSIPLVLRNASKVERAIFVTAIVKAEGKAYEPLALPWEHVEPQSERRFTVETAPLAQGGTHAVGIIATLASRYKGREERYAYAGRVSIVVESPDQQQIVQNINLAGAQFETGGLVHAPVSSRPVGGTSPSVLRVREAIPFERAERYEIEQGIRGYGETGVRVPRDVSFTFSGFLPADHPGDGVAVGMGGALSCGRNSRRFDAQTNPFPNDLCLRIHDQRTGAIDEDATRSLSRHQFDFLVLNDRLCVQVRSSGGLEHNGRKLATGEVRVLRDGDRLAPLPGRAEKLELVVRFRSSVGSAEAIEIAREPRMRAS
jgi:hypothetical protein